MSVVNDCRQHHLSDAVRARGERDVCVPPLWSPPTGRDFVCSNFTRTLDNWDPAVTDALAARRQWHQRRMIPASNSYRVAENLPNAVLLLYPDSGHGSIFQFHDSFTRQAAAFLASDSP